MPCEHCGDETGAIDPLESALISAWNNSPEVMDDYRDEEPEDTSDSPWAW
ncbi:hypothetical protein ACFS5L_29825 [Streptomyces phyllanthi]|nr:hypothetical protein [Streptomyces phyllanthi]